MAFTDQVLSSVKELGGVSDAMAEAKDIWAQIPTSTKAALAKKWALKAANFATDRAMQYDPDEQEKDHRRIIQLGRALSSLQDLESALVRTQVLDVPDLIWKRWKTAKVLWKALHVAWNDVWAVIKSLWNLLFGLSADEFTTAITHLWAGLAASAALVAEILTAKAFIQVALSVMHQRNLCIANMRKKALPQPPAKRYRRRKRAR